MIEVVEEPKILFFELVEKLKFGSLLDSATLRSKNKRLFLQSHD